MPAHNRSTRRLTGRIRAVSSAAAIVLGTTIMVGVAGAASINNLGTTVPSTTVPSTTVASTRDAVTTTAADAAQQSTPTDVSRAATPGAQPTGLRPAVSPAIAAANPLAPFFNAIGKFSLSSAGLGTNDSAGGPIPIKKPAGATVDKAFLMAASTGFSDYTPVDGDVTINAQPVAWDPTYTIANDISSVNVLSDVTSIVKPIVDAAPSGTLDVTVAEPNNTSAIDGEALVVVFNDPLRTTDQSIVLLYGAQNPAGDTFSVGLGSPIDLTNPNFSAAFGLGISYSEQSGAAQYSTVKVNGTLMTSSAGGQDDCVEGPANYPGCANGELMTVGGFNHGVPRVPADPTDKACANEGGNPTCDGEYYDLKPFLATGQTQITLATENPSNDDNIFFASLELGDTSAVVNEGLLLTPNSTTSVVGTNATIMAKAQFNSGAPVTDTPVTFHVTSGPNAGKTGQATTDSSGSATFTYTGETTGTDTIEASFIDPANNTIVSNPVTSTWVDATTTTTSTTTTTVPPSTTTTPTTSTTSPPETGTTAANIPPATTAGTSGTNVTTSGTPLAQTGSNLEPIGWMGLGLLVIGGLFAFGARKRRQRA